MFKFCWDKTSPTNHFFLKIYRLFNSNYGILVIERTLCSKYVSQTSKRIFSVVTFSHFFTYCTWIKFFIFKSQNSWCAFFILNQRKRVSKSKALKNRTQINEDEYIVVQQTFIERHNTAQNMPDYGLSLIQKVKMKNANFFGLIVSCLRTHQQKEFTINYYRIYSK